MTYPSEHIYVFCKPAAAIAIASLMHRMHFKAGQRLRMQQAPSSTSSCHRLVSIVDSKPLACASPWASAVKFCLPSSSEAKTNFSLEWLYTVAVQNASA